MNANITGENEERVGLYVYDNQDVEHWIEMEFDGEIKYHEQDGYADKPEHRTREESEHIWQARRFAKWHVYRERGYDTVPPTENPDRILAALLAVAQQSPAEFETSFADLKTQLRSHADESTIELPFPDADPGDVIIYQKDVYLEPDPIEFDPPVLDQFRARFGGETQSPVVPAADELDENSLDELSFDIVAVSGLHTLHNDGRGTERVDHGEHPLERDPDARVELMAFDASTVDSFQHHVVGNLAFQIRDRFLLMGVTPPVAFQAQGWGTYQGFQCQKFCSLYQEYWSIDANITSWKPDS
jgi:hypothetical protein